MDKKSRKITSKTEIHVRRTQEKIEKNAGEEVVETKRS